MYLCIQYSKRVKRQFVMEIKLPGTDEKEQQYYDSLLAKIREIRASEKPPRQKVVDILKCAPDYDADEAGRMMDVLNEKMTGLGKNGDLRFANCMIMWAEGWAENNRAMTLEDIKKLTRQWLTDADNNQHIYEFPSFTGDYVEADAEDESHVSDRSVRLPEGLAGFKGHHMVLRIEDMDRFIDTFCDRNTYYRRAYAMLAELDEKVMESLEAGLFDDWILIPYKDWGDAMFQFSHFEVDLREPDSQYRTLYVVYRYDTTVS